MKLKWIVGFNTEDNPSTINVFLTACILFVCLFIGVKSHFSTFGGMFYFERKLKCRNQKTTDLRQDL